MKCLTAEAGYNIGDIVTATNGSSGGFSPCYTAWFSATQVGFALASANTLTVAAKTTGVQTNITPANWGLFVVLEYG